MLGFDANQIANQLQQKVNLSRVSNFGNTKIWFSNKIPDELPVGSEIKNIFSENLSLPYNHYRVLSTSLSGGLIFWKHLGARCMAAGAFISIRPLNSGKAVVEIELSEGNFAKREDDLWIDGFETQDCLPFFCKGLTEGLLMSRIDHPVADVKIRILSALTHKIDTSAKAFEVLGNYLTEAMVLEMYKYDWIDVIKRPEKFS